MSLYGILRTGVSGMAAQSNKLGTIADNVANSGTVGYKKATAQFSTFVLDAGSTSYDSGAVTTKIAHAIGQQGPLSYTSSPTDLAIEGNGFLVVQDARSVPYLTRAGAFNVDAKSGNLVNTAGYTLLGYPVVNGSTNVVTNGTTGLSPINISGMNLQAKPSTEGKFLVNLPSSAPVAATVALGALPAQPVLVDQSAGDFSAGDNNSASQFGDKSTVTAYDNNGKQVTLDVFRTKVTDAAAPGYKWEVAVYNHDDVASATADFPYSSGPLSTTLVSGATPGPSVTVAVPNGLPFQLYIDGSAPAGHTVPTYTDKSSIVAYDNVGNAITLDMFMTKTADDTWEVDVYNHADAPADGTLPYNAPALTSQALTFDKLGALASSPPSLSIAVPNGQTVKLDLTGVTQLAAPYTPLNVAINGSAPATVSGVNIDKDGTVYATYENGSRAAAFRIPLAMVQSPDNLTPVAGNAYSTTPESGEPQVGFPQEAGRGSLVSSALEQSNVDMASELTDMIVAQRDYTANSKVVQTGSELLDVLMNLKR